MVAVGKVVERPALVDDADRRFLRADLDVLDVVRRLAHVLELLVEDVRGLGGGLGVCERGRGVSQCALNDDERDRDENEDARNSAGNEILKRTFSMMLRGGTSKASVPAEREDVEEDEGERTHYEPYGRWNWNSLPLNRTS